MTNPARYLDELRSRLKNPAVSDSELLTYIEAAGRDVSPIYQTGDDYDAQILDTCCLSLMLDKKFPEVGSISSNGVSISLSHGGIEQLQKRIRARRWAALRNRFR